MTQPAPEASAAAPVIAKRTWHYWRGTPELLGQVMRAAQRALEPALGEHPRCSVVVEVAHDEEAFDSPADFVEHVTTEALRDFSSIIAEIGEEPLQATLALRWRAGARWKPSLRTHDADIVLTVEGADEAAVNHACRRIRHSVERGTFSWRREVLFGFGFGFLAAAVFAAAVLSAGYLIKLPSDTQGISLVASLAVVLVVGMPGTEWLYPALEVARAGNFNWRRAAKTVGPAALTLILSGLAKKLFG